METIIFISIIILSILITVYLSLKKEFVCPECRSAKVRITGEKRYKEDPPIALWGSPDSYYEDEFKCSDCGKVFWAKRKVVITN